MADGPVLFDPDALRYVAGMLEKLADGIHALHDPSFRFFLMHIGSRMTALRLADGGIILHSPVAFDGAAKDAIDALGPVRFIVAPSLFHHLFTGDAAKAWPEAEIVAPIALRKKRKDLAIAFDLESPPPSWSGTIDVLPIGGSMIGESALFHRPTGTLVSSDLIENFTEMEHGLTRAYLRLNGVYRKPGWARMLRMVYRDRQVARASLEAILEKPIERIVIAHGDPIVARPKETLREGLAFLLG